MHRVAPIVCLTVLMCGCSSVKDGFVVREWSSNMRELGIYPVFPPREDLYVGDVFVSYEGVQDTPEGKASSFPAMGLHLASLDLSNSLKAHYATRPEFPASSASAAAAASVFDPPTQQTRLKTVAFPFFLKATATGAEIGALIPVDALPWKAGLGLNSVKSASVSVSAAESYSLPWILLADNLVDRDGKFGVPSPGHAASSAETLQLLNGVAVSQDGKPAKYVDVTVISEVFYARSFDITLHLSSDAALSIAGSLPSAAESAASAATAVAGSASQAAAVAATSPASGAASAAQSAMTAAGLAATESAKLQGLLDRSKSLAPLTPGISVGVTTSSTGDVGLRRTYERPIAVGYRGIRYRVDLVNGKVLTLPPNGTALFNGEVETKQKLNQTTNAAQPASAASAPKR